jgi:BirA family biotin operon repressor/biotin-[acetyl-CoA-carboxylase] ligase
MASSFDAARKALEDTRFSHIRDVAVTASTNDDISRILGDAGASGCTIVADYQERGVGRKGRAWIAPPASALLFTTALPQPIATRDLWIVPFWVALAMRAALLDHAITIRLQWPNDLLRGDRKLGGILCVSRVSGARAWVGCGVGINVVRPAAPAEREALASIVPPPAFCSDDSTVAREALLETILRRFDAMLDLLQEPADVARRWEEAAEIPGTRYRLLVDGESAPFDAEAVRLAGGGALVVRIDGREREIALADARVVRE